jgi:ankyrin repeat protein
MHIANKSGLTPMYSAGRNKHVEVVRELVNHGAQVDTSKETGRTFVRRAADNGYLDVIRELLK